MTSTTRSTNILRKLFVPIIITLSLCTCVTLFSLWSIDSRRQQEQQISCHEELPKTSQLPPHSSPFDSWPPPLSHAICRPLIYIYTLPQHLLPLEGQPSASCSAITPNAYRSEVVLLAKLSEEPFASLYTTKDPQKATHFFIPFFGSCWLFSHCFDKQGRTSSVDGCGVDSKYVTPLLDYIANEFPWWNKTSGRNHIAIHPMDRRLGYYSDKRLRQTISLVTNGDRRSASGFRTTRELVIPSISAPLVKGANPERYLGQDGNFNERTIVALFRGHFTSSNNPAENEAYGHGIRWLLSQPAIRNQKNWVIGNKQHILSWYANELSTTKFGISPEGWTLDNTRLWDYLAFGVVPIIIADGIVLPFEDDIDWNSFSVRIRREDAHRLPEIIKSVPSEKLLRMQKRIWKEARFMLCEYDAWHYIARGICRISDISEPQILSFNSSLHSSYFWNNPHYY